MTNNEMLEKVEIHTKNGVCNAYELLNDYTKLEQEKEQLIKHLEEEITAYQIAHIAFDGHYDYDLNKEIRDVYKKILEMVKSGKYE